MFEDLESIQREREVRRTLKAIARQRVAMVLPNGVQVIELSPPREEWFELGVLTCLIRGWVEVLHEDLPTGAVSMQGNSPLPPTEMRPKTHYRLTEGGWAVLNRTQGWVVATFLVSAASLAAGVASLVVACIALPP